MKKELPLLGGSRGAYNFNVSEFLQLIDKTVYFGFHETIERKVRAVCRVGKV